MELFTLLELEIDAVRKLPLLNSEEVADLVWNYRCLKGEVTALNYEIDTFNSKSETIYSKIQVMNEGTRERNEAWIKFRLYVKEINRFEKMKKGILTRLYVQRKLIEDLSRPLFR